MIDGMEQTNKQKNTSMLWFTQQLCLEPPPAFAENTDSCLETPFFYTWFERPPTFFCQFLPRKADFLHLFLETLPVFCVKSRNPPKKTAGGGLAYLPTTTAVCPES